MATTKILEFEDYKIQNAHIAFFDSLSQTMGELAPLGCFGTLGIEPELKTISKVCSGETVKEVTKAIKLNCTISAHVKPDVAIDVLGLTSEGLKEGVYGYNGKKSARGMMVLEVVDMYEEQKKLIAIPNIAFTTGLVLNIESGQEEIAMMDMSFTGLRDDNGYFYYQAYEIDLVDPVLKETWTTAFTTELVTAEVVAGG